MLSYCLQVALAEAPEGAIGRMVPKPCPCKHRFAACCLQQLRIAGPIRNPASSAWHLQVVIYKFVSSFAGKESLDLVDCLQCVLEI